MKSTKISVQTAPSLVLMHMLSFFKVLGQLYVWHKEPA